MLLFDRDGESNERTATMIRAAETDDCPQWYRRSEAQKRFSFFFSSTTLAGAFGGLLAAAIGKMSGLRGYAGWRWVRKYYCQDSNFAD